MKLSYKDYKNNVTIFAAEDGINTHAFDISFDGMKFICLSELETYIENEISYALDLDDNIGNIENIDIIESIALRYSEFIVNYKEDFKRFLDENLKNTNYDFQAYCEDLENQYFCTGNFRYELSKFKTKSGHTEEFRYD